MNERSMAATAPLADDPAEVTPAWVTEALAAAGIAATAAEVSLSRVHGGLMGTCYRLRVAYLRGDGPARLIVKLPASDPAIRTFAARIYRAEVLFYRDLAPRLPVRVPACYVAALGEAGRFTLMLEDMAPAAAGDQVAGCTPEQARDAVVAVAGLHAGSWCDQELRNLDWLVPPTWEYAAKLGSAFAEWAETFVGKPRLDPATSAVVRDFADRFFEWAAGHEPPFALLHSDYRPENLLFPPAATPGTGVAAIDWQSLTTGQPLRDVGYLLGTSMDVGARRAHEGDLIAAYNEALGRHGVRDYDLARCWHDYRHGLFEGIYVPVMADAIGPATERGPHMSGQTATAERSAERRFSVMVERAAVAIADHDGFDVL